MEKNFPVQIIKVTQYLLQKDAFLAASCSSDRVSKYKKSTSYAVLFLQ